MPYVPSKLNPNLEVLGEVQEFNFPNTQNRGRVDIRTELVPTAGVPTQSGLSLKDSAFNGYRFEYESCLDTTQNKLGLYKVTNNVRAAAPILWVDNTGKVTFNSEAFAQAPTLDGHVATKKYVDDHSGGGGGGDATKAYVDQQDAANLVSAKTYADTGDAATLDSAKAFSTSENTTTLASAKAYADAGDTSTLTSAKAYSDSQDAVTLQAAKDYTDSHIPNITEVHTETMTYTMDDPLANLFRIFVKGGLEVGGWKKTGYLNFNFSDHSIRLGMTPDVGLGDQTYLEITKDSIYAQLKTIEQVTSSNNPQGLLNKATIEAKIADGNSATLTSANTHTNQVITTKADTTYVDSQDAATLAAAKTYTDGKSSPFVLDSNSIAVANALGLRIRNNASSATYSVFLNGNGDGWTETYSETWSNIWSRTISFKTTTYLTFQNASGVNSINASQPIVMASTYTPTAAKHVATKDYVDGKSASLPIDASGSLNVDFSGKTSPSYTNSIDTGTSLTFGSSYYVNGLGYRKQYIKFDSSTGAISLSIDFSGTIATPYSATYNNTDISAQTVNIKSSNQLAQLKFYGSASSSAGLTVESYYQNSSNYYLSIYQDADEYIKARNVSGIKDVLFSKPVSMYSGYSPTGVNHIVTKGTIDNLLPIGTELTVPKNYKPPYGTWLQCSGGSYATDGTYSTLQTVLTASGRTAGVLPNRTAPDSFTWIIIRAL